MTENDRSGTGSIPDERYNNLVERVEELEAGGGGSLPMTIVSVELTPATPNVLTGVELYVPTAGDFLISAGVSISEAWDGTSPRLALLTAGSDPTMGDCELDTDLTNPDSPLVTGFLNNVANLPAPPLILDGTGPVVARVYQAVTNGDPGSTIGVASVEMVIVHAP